MMPEDFGENTTESLLVVSAQLNDISDKNKKNKVFHRRNYHYCSDLWF